MCSFAHGDLKEAGKVTMLCRKGRMRGKMQDMCTSLPWGLAALCARKVLSSDSHELTRAKIWVHFSGGTDTV